MLALSLIDSGLVLARSRDGAAAELLDEAPGIAVLEENATLTGAAATERVRLRPLLAQTNFWRTLSIAPLTRPSALARTSADIAFAQAQALLNAHRGERVLLAVPVGLTREQLGLLVGVINETGVSVAGLVDAALAACSLTDAPARVLHLELELQQATLSVLDHSAAASALKRTRYEIAPRRGWMSLQQAWLQLIAEQFVRKTRFDPLHEAASEQRLLDQLPGWLASLRDAPHATLSMQFRDRALEIDMERAQFIAAAEAHYNDWVRLVQSARVAGLPVEVRVSSRLAALPGFMEQLSTLRDCALHVLPHGAAAFGALLHQSSIERSAEALALITQLPVQRAELEGVSALDDETPAPLRPTHVLFQGRAWRIDEQPLVVGWAVNGDARALHLPSAAPGLSRQHCTLVRRNGAVLIEDHSTYGSFVNEERVVGRSVLQVGDRVRLGAPGVSFEMIQLVTDDGAPQD